MVVGWYYDFLCEGVREGHVFQFDARVCKGNVTLKLQWAD